MTVLADLRYTKDHEWTKLDDGVITIGITEYAQGELGDVVYVDLPAIGDTTEKDDSFGSIEAVKAVADLFSPVSGEVVEINEALQDAPETINKDPYGDGWMIKMKVSDVSQFEALMDAETYKKHIE